MIVLSRYEEAEEHMVADEENTLLVSRKKMFISSATTQVYSSFLHICCYSSTIQKCYFLANASRINLYHVF